MNCLNCNNNLEIWYGYESEIIGIKCSHCQEMWESEEFSDGCYEVMKQAVNNTLKENKFPKDAKSHREYCEKHKWEYIYEK
jgi:hypothetical protein